MPKGYPAPAVERFWLMVDKTETCWLWMGSRPDGYGRFADRSGHYVLAHRFAYEQLVGPVPEGLELDHLCFVKACVRPTHLEPVTHEVNSNRSPHNRSLLEAVACKNGHPWTEENTYRDRIGGPRRCRECSREHARRIYAKRGHRRKEVTA